MVRRWLIWTHRYLGIPVSVLFVLWFASGIVMMYTGDMPRLTPDARLDGLTSLDLSAVRLAPGDAAARSRVSPTPRRATLGMVLGRPAYRFDGVTVFADTGDRLAPLRPDEALEAASRFAGVPPRAIEHRGLVEEPDQWTLVVRASLPAYRFAVNDGRGTEVYVARRTAEVAMVTTRRSRMLAWLGAIPHWFYLPALRIDRPLWEGVIVWTSAIGCLIAVTGLLLGLIQFRWRRPRDGQSRLVYVGLMRWHYLTGVVFGAVTLTWVFSGLLSVQPFAWMTVQGLHVPADALAGGPLRLADFPAIDPAAWNRVTGRRRAKEVTLRRIDGAPHYEVDLARELVDGSQHDRLRLSAEPLAPQRTSFDVETVVARLSEVLPGVSVVGVAELNAYDAYYYGRGRSGPPLPVIRLEFSDPMETWVYLDPANGQLVLTVHRYSRLERWLFNGLHSLDFAFWYDRRPLWDIGVIVLSIGGLASSGIGLWVGAGRVRRWGGRGRGQRARRRR